ncbi:hypothetical protein F2Q65_11485 [Thiohalocapsa marina]|uniref:Glycosyltransferase RgtA/B/C/D-like domain-containing protein n=1 Tax=Thiohalocapsa marina TaxID=424902 RepID=A0A5M8FQE8_9GAMM|nr:hypothetical protein [Thiohalocapsa marina]KAA6184715.1 hypothetical protein F2Q65_11485 [Thiohalocapsa marina]
MVSGKHSDTDLKHPVLWSLAVVLALLGVWRGTQGQIIEGLPFKDPDDLMRMLQALALWDGAAWHDLTMPRLNPPEGVLMHWSRLPDLPLVAILALSEPVLGRDAAVLVAAFLVPVLLGLGFFTALIWAARPLTGRDGQLYSALVVLALSIPLLPFAAGRIDHHGWQLLLALISAGAVLRVAAGGASPWLPVMAGIAGALGLWVGAEAIPSVALSGGVLGLVWLRRGRWGADRLAGYGLSLTLTSALLLPVALAPGQRVSTACDAFSLLSVGLCAAVLLLGLASTALERQSRFSLTLSARLLAGVGLGTLLLGALYLLFPHCAAGPYAENSQDAALLVSRVQEAQSLWSVIRHTPATAVYHMALPVLALLMATWRVLRGAEAERTLWLGLVLLVAGGLLLQFWQLRGTYLANSYAGLVLCWWAASVGAKVGEARGLLQRLLRRGGPALTVALLPILLPLLVVRTAETSTATAEPAEKIAPCDMRKVANLLNEPIWTDTGPLLIAAPVNNGATLLFLTPHQVLAAPYHRNASGLRDQTLMFYRDQATAREAIMRRGVDLLLVCEGDPVLSHERREGSTLFADQLLQGSVPDWLEPLPLSDGPLLFRVQHAVAASDGSR